MAHQCTSDDVRDFADDVAHTWGEFADEPVIEAADEAAAALRKLHGAILEMRGL